MRIPLYQRFVNSRIPSARTVINSLSQFCQTSTRHFISMSQQSLTTLIGLIFAHSTFKRHKETAKKLITQLHSIHFLNEILSSTPTSKSQIWSPEVCVKLESLKIEAFIDFQSPGVPASKIVLGIPTYGRVWSVPEGATATGVPPIVETTGLLITHKLCEH